MCTVDFLDAHERHWKDAETLRGLERYENADHLYGFAFECGLKAHMGKFDMEISGGLPNQTSDRVHADRIAARFETYRQGKFPNTSKYQLSDQEKQSFHSWRASQRYCKSGFLSEAGLQKHQQGARGVRMIIKQARIDGLLP